MKVRYEIEEVGFDRKEFEVTRKVLVDDRVIQVMTRVVTNEKLLLTELPDIFEGSSVEALRNAGVI